jgi:ATP-dependent helicase/nuclease subunit A
LCGGRRAGLALGGATATLATNFRSHPELLRAFNLAFAPRFDASFTPLIAGREEPDDTAASSGPRVELLVVDRSPAWEGAGLVAPGAVPPAPLWRLAEARLLAARVEELIAAGRPPGEIVLLLRATGDLAVYERALVERGVPTYVIGGRGYWSQQQVRDLVAYLSVLANPRDGVALYTLLASPLVGLSSDGLVHVAAAARAAERDPWWTLSDDAALPGRLDAEDRARVERLRGWLPQERRDAPRHGLEDLIDRALARTGYDEVLLRMEGGARRMANVRKLMRLAREHEAQHGRDLRGFADLVSSLVGGADASGDERESEAPVEGEALDAVRVMTIHRAKGLEFPVVCVADLGRESPAAGREPVRVGDDGRVGIRLKRLGGARPRNAFAYRALVEQQRRRDAEEEARLFYVAVTRAREQLILSGAATCDPWPEAKPGAPPISWLAPAFVPDITRRCAPDASARSVASHDEVSIAVTVARPDLLATLPTPSTTDADRAGGGEDARAPVARPGCAHPEGHRRRSRWSGPARSSVGPERVPPVDALSYTAMAQHAQCGYRFYLERVLGLPPVDEARFGSAQGVPAALDPRVRGRIVHSLLEALDFARPAPPGSAAVAAEAARAGARLTDAAAQEIAQLIVSLLATELPARLAALKDLRREQPFALALDAVPLIGVFDLVGHEGDRTLVVDWKSDRLDPDADPRVIADADYGLQRAAYALAALRDGAREVEVLHVFLERPHTPATATYRPQDLPQLTAELQARADAILGRNFPVAPEPGPSICDGCPGRGSLCSWPLEATFDAPEGRLF